MSSNSQLLRVVWLWYRLLFERWRTLRVSMSVLVSILSVVFASYGGEISRFLSFKSTVFKKRVSAHRFDARLQGGKVSPQATLRTPQYGARARDCLSIPR